MAPRFARRLIHGQIEINSLLGFTSGIVFLCTMLFFSVGFPNPTPFQVRVFVTTLALAAAGVGAILPGYFDLQYKGFIRAGGALGLFAVVFFNQPILEKQGINFVAPSSTPEPVAGQYLSFVDGAQLESAWNALDEVARGTMVASLDQLRQIYNSFRAPLGKALTRDLVGTSSVQSPPGYPVGLYRNLVYRTKFSDAQNCRPESVVLRATQDLQWRVFSHMIGPSSIDC